MDGRKQNIQGLRNSIDKLLREKQTQMTSRRYNKFWRDIAESWTSKDKLNKLKKRIEKVQATVYDYDEIVFDDDEPINNFNFDDELFTETRTRKAIKKPTVTENNKYRTTLTEYKIENDTEITGIESLQIIYHSIPLILKTLKIHPNIKVSFHFKMKFSDGDDELVDPVSHSMKSIRILDKTQVRDVIDQSIPELKTFIEEFEGKGSGLLFKYVETMYVNISKYQPYRGGSYIELDEYIKNKKCCLNIQNEDEKCLMYCVLYHINKDKIKKDPQRVTKYKPYLNQFDFSTIKFPTPIRDIPKVEKIIDYGINLFLYDDKKVFPNYVTERRDDKIINLLLIKDGNKEHYIYISKLDILITKNVRDEEGKHEAKRGYPCPNCLHRFSSEFLLNRHRENGCDIFEPQRTMLPSPINPFSKEFEQPTIKFHHHNNKFKQPVVIYADFETICKKIEHTHDTSKSGTSKFIEQVPCGFCFNVVSDYPELNLGMEYYRGENTINRFLKKLMDYSDEIREKLKINKPMIITPEQEQEFLKCEHCHICGGKINDNNIPTARVRDHDHYNGLYRGCAHSKCNLNLNYDDYKIPVYFHNLKGFDGHLIIKELGKMNIGNIKIIAQNFEKYVTFSFKNLQFLDSFAFLGTSLDSLAKNLLKDGKGKFKHTLSYQSNSACGRMTEEQENLILKKGVYPYEYMDNFEKFHETQLPEMENFYSTLTEVNISDDEYNHAQNVWNKFNIQNLGEYHDLYLKTDVLLLTDIFENFRITAMSYYNLDPCSKNYFTLPGYAWDSLLLKTGISLDQLTDIDKYIFCEKGLRGGISMITHRYAKANNKYMKDYEPNDISSYIMYLDANNLYGLAMVQSLPTSNFEWYDYKKIKRLGDYHRFINDLKCEGDTGYFVEVDLHYPEHLHNTHNSYPLAPEKKAILKKELSPYQLNQLETHNEKHSEKIEKLVPNFYDKIKYVCHIKNLKYYIQKGLVIKKIHRVLQFKQSEWMKPYIDFNTACRARSKNDFEKGFFKLMNNAVFGKTMENMRNRVDIRLFNDEKQILKQVAKPQYETHKIYENDKLVAIKQTKSIVKLDKPIYVGLAVLDLSKLHMYKFHYDYILPKYGNNQQLLFTDTDSLCYKIETEDFYKDMKKDSHLYDLTDSKMLGLFKDETVDKEGNDDPIVEFVGLRSKMYSIKTESGKEKKTGKGIKRLALEKKVPHEDYRKCILDKNFEKQQDINCQRQKVSFNNMRSIDHTIYAFKYTRTGLSCSNDKQYLLDDGIKSLSYGHKDIPK